MKSFTTILSLCIAMLFSTSISSQDFYGAGLTGKHTWGVNVKYNGDFWVGTHYNYRRFGGFGSNPLDVNVIAELKIDKGISSIGTELGFGQVYANGNNFQPSFGLGARYGLRAEYCPVMKNEELDNPCTSNLSLNVALKPGYYTNAYAVAATIETDPIKFYFGESNVGYKKEAKADAKVDFRIFERLGVGAHVDWTNALKSVNGRYHLTADYNHNFYLSMKNNPAWNTFYGDYDVDANSEDANEGNCTMPERNFEVLISNSLRF